MRHRSGDAFAPEVRENVGWVSCQRVRPEVAGPMTSSATQPTMLSGGFRFALRTLRNSIAKEKKEAERRQTCSANLRILRCGARVRTGSALAYRRSTTALTVRAFGPWAQLQARLPGTWQDVRSCKVAPTGERRSRALTQALPAPACPSPGNAPPGPVVVPVSMMPKAARMRSVSFRARAPHSLHLSEYLRDRRPR